jgi:electron transport complex protein RnfB
MVPVTGERTGWDAWSDAQAHAARERHDRRSARLERERQAISARAAARRAEAAAGAAAHAGQAAQAAPSAADDEAAKKRAIIQAALERARRKKEALAGEGNAPKDIAGTGEGSAAPGALPTGKDH